jgi:HD-GYP domain-containing protein (c-di-GMP phosphodiesterase class II)
MDNKTGSEGQIEHYLKPVEIERLKKAAELFAKHKDEIKQNWINILYQIRFIDSEAELQYLDKAFQTLIDDFAKYLPEGDIDSYYKGNKKMARELAYNDIPFGKYNEIFNLFEQSYLNILVKNIVDKDELNAYLFTLSKLHHKTVTIVSEVYFELNDQLIMALGKLTKIHDLETGLHLERTQRYAVLLAEQMGLEKDIVEAVRRAGPLHDIGLVGVSDYILKKHYGEWSDEELKLMAEHTEIGAKVLDEIIVNNPVSRGFLLVARDIALYHHERYDGSGYPGGLKGEKIPLVARIFAVADFYDTMRSVRKQKEPWSHEKVVKEIKSQLGKAFDPKVAEAFLEVHPKFEKISQEILDNKAEE